MTNIKIIKKHNDIVSFEIFGHTGFDDYGKDILCASLSSISQSVVLGITKVLKINAVVKKDDKKGYLKLSLPKSISQQEMADSQILLLTMQKSFEDLLFDYSDYINLEVKNEID